MKLSFILVLVLCLPLFASDQQDLTARVDALFLQRDDPHKLDEAIGLLRNASIENPGDYEIQWRLSRLMFYKSENGKDKDEKIKALAEGIVAAKKAIVIDPKRPEGHFWLASDYGESCSLKGIWSSLALLRTIRREFELVLQIDPLFENGRVYQALGEMDLRVPGILGGNDDRGMDLLKKGAKETPTNMELKLTLAQFLAQKGHTAESLQLLEEVLAMDDPSRTTQEQEDVRKKARVWIEKLSKTH